MLECTNNDFAHALIDFNGNPSTGLKGGRTRCRNDTGKCGILEMALKSEERKYAFSSSDPSRRKQSAYYMPCRQSDAMLFMMTECTMAVRDAKISERTVPIICEKTVMYAKNM